MPENEYRLEMHNISKHFGGVNALDDVSFFVKPGENHALVGENGAGKSTLMKVLSGLYLPDQGEIFIDGNKVHIANTRDGLDNGVSVIYQEFALVRHLSVAENIFLDEFSTKQHKFINWRDLRKRASILLNELGFGGIHPDVVVGDLTVAYQQVVEICKALSRDASILVLDEPTAVLTSEEISRLFGLLEGLKARGVSIIYITHRLDEIFSISDRITVLKDGMFVKTVNKEEVNEDQLVSLMIGRNMETYFPKRESHIGETVLAVENVKADLAVKDVSFNVRKGEVLGLTGLVGAGRTEAIRAIMGFDKMDAGKIFLNGNEVTVKSPRHAYALGMGMLPEDRKASGVLLQIPIKHNVTMSCLKKFLNTFKFINLKKEDKFAKEYSSEIGVRAASLDNPVSSLSGGNQQKVALARLLASDCQVLLLDEPTRGVDVGSKAEIFNIINSLVAQHYAVVLISSEMAEVIGMCDRVVVMREGRSVGELNKEELTEHNIIRLSMGVNAQ